MKYFFVFGMLILLISPVFSQISTGLQPGECWELIPGHRACCGDNVCSNNAQETCGVCPQDCFCAPNFECNPLDTTHADDRGCTPEGMNTPPSENGESEEPSGCGSAAIVLGLLFLPLASRTNFRKICPHCKFRIYNTKRK